MKITLKPEQEQFIQTQIESGKYGSVDEIVSEAINLLEKREHRLEELCQKIAVGKEQIERGQVTDGEIVFAQLKEKINRITESEA